MGKNLAKSIRLKKTEAQGRAIYASGYGKRKQKDPRVGTGKKPKGSGRRLYTDENQRILLELSLLL